MDGLPPGIFWLCWVLGAALWLGFDLLVRFVCLSGFSWFSGVSWFLIFDGWIAADLGTC